MKKILFIIAVVLISITATAQIKSATLQASGLTCSMCNLSIKKSLEKLPFIEQIKPNVETATYEIAFKENTAIVLEDLQKAVKKAGFSVAKLSFTSSFNNVSIANKNTFELNGISYYIINPKSNVLNGSIAFQIIGKDYTGEKDFKRHKQKLNPQFVNVIQL